ncbi:MAG: ABC transporter ATP-binding protein [Lachnospiraceae bacterium]|nr:ABC transporter ATP-binding protein [Lachnospiraceae bacterium]
MEIRIRQVSKSYGEKEVWRDLNLAISPGSSTALMGASGCGKTTLLRMMMRLEEPDRGSIEGVPQRISAVFQEDRLCPGFTAAENIEMVMQTHNREELLGHLTRLGLGDSLDKPVETLSGGMKRRVAIARAYLAPSEMIFLDEPLKGLDEDTKASVIAWMQEQRQGRTVLLVTHDRGEAGRLAEQILELDAPAHSAGACS